MKGERIFALTAVSLLLSLSIMSTVEVKAADYHITSLINEKIEEFKTEILSLNTDHQNGVNLVKALLNRDGGNNRIYEIKEHLFTGLRNIDFSGLESNFTSLDLIGMLFGSLMFLLMTQPIFLQFIVETQNQFLFVVILISLLFTEVFQKFFALKVVGFWDPYIKNDVDGIWNFFTIVFFSSYIKIYLSYLPTFIIQYSNVFTKVFFYALMFAIPILFNICIADSIDMIDWNGDERPISLNLT